MSHGAEVEPNAWHSYRLRPVSSDEQEVVAWYGGHPRGVTREAWPHCKVCGAAMCHMAQYNAGPHLFLGSYARMSLFICHATGGRCEDWDPYLGANRVLLHPEIDDNLYDGPTVVRVYRRLLLTVDPPLDELALMIRVKKEGLEMTEALKQMLHDKLGGGAVWLTMDETPQSQLSQAPLRLVAQLTTLLTGFDITVGGMGYVYLDSAASGGQDEAVFLWQGA